jgi:hypothetical protein
MQLQGLYRFVQFSVDKKKYNVRTCTVFMRFAKSKVFVVSEIALVSGLMVHITLIRAFPDNDGWSIRVSLELRNGTWSLEYVLLEHTRIHWEAVLTSCSSPHSPQEYR